MRFKFIQEVVKMFRCHKHEEPQTVPTQAVEIPALLWFGETESVIPASSRTQEAQVQADDVVEVYVVPAQPVPKTGTEVPVMGPVATPTRVLEPNTDTVVAVPPTCKVLDMDALFQKLPSDCHGHVIDSVTGLKGGHCGRIACRSCSSFRHGEIIKTTTRAAADLGLRYLVTVSVPFGVGEKEQCGWLDRAFRGLWSDAEVSVSHPVSYVCMRGLDSNGKPNLNLLTNVDYRLGVDPADTKADYRARRLGRTFRPLLHWHLVELHELGYGEVGAEVKRMTRKLVEHLVSGCKSWWNVVCSYQYRDYQSGGDGVRLRRVVRQIKKKREAISL